MTDIVERLRDQYHETGGLAILLLAADEIERLRALLREARKDLHEWYDFYEESKTTLRLMQRIDAALADRETAP